MNNNNTTRKNNKNARNRRTRANALAKGVPLPTPSTVTKNFELSPAEKIIVEAQAKLRKSFNENTPIPGQNNYGFGSGMNIRTGLPDEQIVERAVERWATVIAEAEKQNKPEVTIRFPIRVAKTLLSVLLFFLSFFTLPARFIATVFGALKAKLKPVPQPSYNNFGRTASMIEEGRFGSSANQAVNW